MPSLLLFFSFLCFTTYHSLLVMEVQQIGPFSLVSSTSGDLTKGIYPSKRYEDIKGHYVNVIQTFPPELKTNFFIKTEKKLKKIF
jgi:hypothetical protein